VIRRPYHRPIVGAGPSGFFAAPTPRDPLTIAPLWDPKMAAAEVERCVSKGAKAVAFSENPEPLGFPSVHDFDYWHPLFSAVEDAGIPVCTHIGSSSKIRTPSSDCPPIGSIAYMVLAASAATLIDWLFGGHFLRYPRIKLCLSEGGIGWMPYVLERAEQVYDKQRHWYRKMDAATSKGKLLGTQSVETNQNVIDLIDSGIRPTELFRDHVYGCFFDDRAGVEMLDAIGEDNVMVESDYPHSDSNWPNTMDVISPQIKGLNETTQRKLLQLNAVRVFDLELPPPPV
jgi:predicted TIM-barrel fold metal-dependent hydrolase